MGEPKWLKTRNLPAKLASVLEQYELDDTTALQAVRAWLATDRELLVLSGGTGSGKSYAAAWAVHTGPPGARWVTSWMTSYRARLEEADALGHGFEYGELVSLKALHRKLKPPRYMWDRMIPTLRFAIQLREMVRSEGGSGLRVAAAFRPVGGASNSQHKHNRALDLDLLPGNYDLTEVYYQAAAAMWCGWVDSGHEVGLGLYCPEGARGGIRVHVDVGYRTRTWQLWRGKYVKNRLGDALAKEYRERGGS